MGTHPLAPTTIDVAGRRAASAAWWSIDRYEPSVGTVVYRCVWRHVSPRGGRGNVARGVNAFFLLTGTRTVTGRAAWTGSQLVDGAGAGVAVGATRDPVLGHSGAGG